MQLKLFSVVVYVKSDLPAISLGMGRFNIESGRDSKFGAVRADRTHQDRYPRELQRTVFRTNKIRVVDDRTNVQKEYTYLWSR